MVRAGPGLLLVRAGTGPGLLLRTGTKLLVRAGTGARLLLRAGPGLLGRAGAGPRLLLLVRAGADTGDLPLPLRRPGALSLMLLWAKFGMLLKAGPVLLLLRAVQPLLSGPLLLLLTSPPLFTSVLLLLLTILLLNS